MKEFILKLLAALGIKASPATVDSALAEFYKAKNKLIAAAKSNETMIELQEAALRKAEEARAAAQAELARAKAVAEKLEDLLGL